MEGLFTGVGDHPLTEHGREQMRAWRATLGSLDVARCVASPLSRAVESAREAGFEPEVVDGLIEWNLGSLEGRHASAFRKENLDWNLYVDGPPDGTGESPTDVRDRASEVLRRMTDDATSDSVTVAFSHGQFTRVLAMEALGLPTANGSRLSMGPGRAMVLIERLPGAFSLAGWNVAPRALLEELT